MLDEQPWSSTREIPYQSAIFSICCLVICLSIRYSCESLLVRSHEEADGGLSNQITRSTLRLVPEHSYKKLCFAFVSLANSSRLSMHEIHQAASLLVSLYDSQSWDPSHGRETRALLYNSTGALRFHSCWASTYWIRARSWSLSYSILRITSTWGVGRTISFAGTQLERCLPSLWWLSQCFCSLNWDITRSVRYSWMALSSDLTEDELWDIGHCFWTLET